MDNPALKLMQATSAAHSKNNNSLLLASSGNMMRPASNGGGAGSVDPLGLMGGQLSRFNPSLIKNLLSTSFPGGLGGATTSTSSSSMIASNDRSSSLFSSELLGLDQRNNEDQMPGLNMSSPTTLQDPTRKISSAVNTARSFEQEQIAKLLHNSSSRVREKLLAQLHHLDTKSTLL